MPKFFFAAAVWGRLRLRDIPDGDTWDAGRITYWDETFLDGVSRLALSGRKVRTTAQLDQALAVSLRAPGIQPLWIHEDLIADARSRWGNRREDVRAAAARRWRAAGAIASAVTAGFLAGYVMAGQGPLGLPAPSAPARFAAPSVPTLASAYSGAIKTRTPRMPRVRAAERIAAAIRAALPAPILGYAVKVGTFANAAAADRMRHLVLRKGYVVVVVRRGALSQVVTPPYRTRVQAERAGRGLAASGIPEEITTWRGL